MQQKQKKPESISKKTSNFAAMMLQRDKNRLKEQQKHDYIELLEKTRGKEYLRLLAEMARLCEQLAEVEEEVGQLETELAQEVSEEPPAIERPTDERAAKEQPHIQVGWKRERIDTGARMKQFQEKQQRLAEMKWQRERMAEQFRASMRELEAQLPVPERWVGIIWPDWNTEILMKYGVIGCPGSAFRSAEELIEQVQPKSEQAEQQWRKGYEAYQIYFCKELLLVEIYMDVVCVVYRDGHTLVVE